MVKKSSDKTAAAIELLDINKTTNELILIMNTKIKKIQDIIQRAIVALNQNKKQGIINNCDLAMCLSTLNDLYKKTVQLRKDAQNTETFIVNSQHIVDKLSILMYNYGASKIDDLLFITFGTDFVNNQTFLNDYAAEKYTLITKYIRPLSYKMVHWKQMNKNKEAERQTNPYVLCENKMSEEITPIEWANSWECFDADPLAKIFIIKSHGIRIVVHNENAQKTIIIHGICEDMLLDCIENTYISQRMKGISEKMSVIQDQVGSNHTVDDSIIKRIIETLTLKDLLVSGNEDIYKKQVSIQNDVNMVMNHKIDILLKKFADMELFNQRNVLINLLIYNKNDEIQYITYLLYDLITINSSQESTDSLEQQMIFDSFPWRIKLYFKEAMKSTLKYTQDMIKKYDTNSITFEQKIFLLKASENVKEKAMTKFKELKGKSDESGAKAKQYLEGLLKIPFGIYKKEPILKTIHIINEAFLKLINKCGGLEPPQSRYTTIEMMKYITGRLKNIDSEVQSTIETNRNKITLKDVTNASIYINQYLEQQKQKGKKIKGKTKNEKLENILDYMKEDNSQAISIKCKIHDLLLPQSNHASLILHDCETIKASIENINVEMTNSMNVLDQSIYGHIHAKNQILKIIGQWMNGEQTGYCFGFEGSPGIGKTSLAKSGLSGCLKDENGVSRPFAFIALGGSSNGSTLEGHSYTYVNSIWGRIVDILMETKCMNPIIYIDELDKVSKTENGKEIIGILTHIIDSTQNDSFQDKYFSGIDIDLSKILFIFSYNDASQIDKILLDRIHRIKFDNLSLEDKLVVVKNYLLPSICKKMGLTANSVNIPDSMVEYIIETYTMEPGIRKLKEILFDLYGEINLGILRCKSYENAVFPIEITKEILEKYLEKYDIIKERIIQKTNAAPLPGIINGLWANVLGKGGILPIEVAFFPSAQFLELKLTGQLGDVMKESMNVAKSLAWSLTPDEKKEEWLKKFEKTKNVGVHVHCPEGAVSKDGPSAGVAITCAIYSLFNNQPIPSKIAITGEIDLRGNITAIGGLDMKILGGIRAGVKTFFFPESNGTDFQKIKKKYVESGKWTTLSEKKMGDAILIEKLVIQNDEIEFIQAKDIKGVLEIIYNNII